MSGEPRIKRTKVVSSIKKTTKQTVKAAPNEAESVVDQDVLSLDATEFLEAFDELSSSSDEEGENGIPIADIPAPPPAKMLSKEETKKIDQDSEPWILYVGRIPHGFFEPQMRAYFSQFGTIVHLRLARNRRTGSSKHYAFIQYDSSSVADIVQRTMNKYLLFGHILQVQRLAPEQVHENIWKGADKRFKRIPWNRIEGKRHSVPRSREVWERRNNRAEERREKMKKICDEYGYEFEIPKVKRVSEVQSKAERERLAAVGDEDQKQIEAAASEEEPVVEIASEKASRKKRKTALEVEEQIKQTEPIKKKAKRKGRA